MLFIDEMAQLGSSLLVALHMILQKVRMSEAPFGGVWIIGAGDHYQTEPIADMSPLTSWLVRHNFDVLNMVHSVRARKDPILQKVIQAMRVPHMDRNTIRWVIDTLKRNCNIVLQPELVPHDCMCPVKMTYFFYLLSLSKSITLI
jgi:hypothetical protein